MMMAIFDKKGRKMKKKFAYIMVKSEDYLLLYKEGGNGNRKNSLAFYSVPTSSIL